MKLFPGFILVGLAALAPSTHAAVHELTVEMKVGSTGKCGATIDGPAIIPRGANSVLLWSFTNQCPAQAVRVCVKTHSSAVHDKPWTDCAGIPAANPPLIGKPFSMGDGTKTVTTANAVCGIEWPMPTASGPAVKEGYLLAVGTAPEGMAPVCPPTGIGTRSELALEVLP